MPLPAVAPTLDGLPTVTPLPLPEVVPLPNAAIVDAGLAPARGAAVRVHRAPRPVGPAPAPRPTLRGRTPLVEEADF
jgi:hypothetical protein